MDQKQAITLARRYKALVAEHFPLQAFYLYGSYSKGDFTDESDIDVAAVVESLSDNYLQDCARLWTLRRKVSTLIEPVLLTPDPNNPLYHAITHSGIEI